MTPPIDRRKFLASALAGGSIGAAGCTGGSNADPSETETESGEVEKAWIDSVNLRSEADMEFKIGFDYTGSKDVTIYLSAIPVVDLVNERENVRKETYKEIPYSEFELPIQVSNPVLLEESFIVQLEYEIEGSPRQVADTWTRKAHMYYEIDGEYKFLDSGGRVVSWEDGEEINYKVIYSLPVGEGIGYNDNVYESFHTTIPEEELQIVQDNHNTDDPLTYLKFTENVKHPENEQSITYLDRPILKSISSHLESVYEKWGITTDYTKVDIAERFTGRCQYKQDKENISGTPITEFPETMLYNGYGDCKDFALLFNGILHHLGYDTTFILIQHDIGSKPFIHIQSGVNIRPPDDLQEDIEEFGEEEFRADDYLEADFRGHNANSGEDGMDYLSFDASGWGGHQMANPEYKYFSYNTIKGADV